jgi:hypothetical protein
MEATPWSARNQPATMPTPKLHEIHKLVSDLLAREELENEVLH